MACPMPVPFTKEMMYPTDPMVTLTVVKAIRGEKMLSVPGLHSGFPACYISLLDALNVTLAHQKLGARS